MKKLKWMVDVLWMATEQCRQYSVPRSDTLKMAQMVNIPLHVFYHNKSKCEREGTEEAKGMFALESQRAPWGGDLGHSSGWAAGWWGTWVALPVGVSEVGERGGGGVV